MSRLLRLALGAVLLATTATACTDERDRFRDTVLDAITATERSPRRLVYAQRDLLGEAVVRAAVADDLRYKAEVEIGGRPAAEEVASDDALAVRFSDPTRLSRFLSRSAAEAVGADLLPVAAPADAAAAAAGSPAPLSESAAAALGPLVERRWVLDDAGAPDLFAVDRSVAVGDDPVLDALEVLAYVRRIVDEHGGVAPYNPDATSYRPDEDPFPRPELGSGVERYDTVQPALPRESDATETGTRPLPELRHFRRLSVYVENGFVIAVRERIDLLSRLGDIREAYDFAVPRRAEGAELEAVLLAGLNAKRQAEGRDALRLRTMSVEFSDFGGDIDVALPADAVPGDLSALRRRGVATVNAVAVVDAEGGDANPVPPASGQPAPAPG